MPNEPPNDEDPNTPRRRLTRIVPPNEREPNQKTEYPRIIITDSDLPLTEPARRPGESTSQELKSLSQSLSKLAKHFVITLCVSGLGVLMHLILVHWFDDPKFFDLVPVRYAIDAGDIAVIATFFIMMIRELWRQQE